MDLEYWDVEELKATIREKEQEIDALKDYIYQLENREEYKEYP